MCQVCKNKVKWTIGNFFNLKRFGIYRSFGVKEIIRPNISNFDEEKSKKYFKKIYSKLKNKADILDIEIDNILIGDLIYDTYLKKYVEPTIEIKSKIFKDLLYDFLKLYFYWASYLKKNKITSIVGSHSLYSYGLILRIDGQIKLVSAISQLSLHKKVSTKCLIGRLGHSELSYPR